MTLSFKLGAAGMARGDLRTLSNEQVLMLQAAIRESGAVEHVERIIQHNVGLATAALQSAPITASAREQLIQLADTVIKRSA